MIQPKKQDTSPLFKVEIEARKTKMIDFCNQAYPELKGKMHILLEFMRNEKRTYVNKELQKKLEKTTNINRFTLSLK